MEKRSNVVFAYYRCIAVRLTRVMNTTNSLRKLRQNLCTVSENLPYVYEV